MVQLPSLPLTKFKHVKKRDGQLVPFDQNRITQAVVKALNVTGEGGSEDAQRVSDSVVRELKKKFSTATAPDIESIQDAVEHELILLDYPTTAKSYILYRQARSQLREKRKKIPQRVKDLVAQSKKYFKNALGEFVYYRTYSRWIDEEGRRETWMETVDRYMNFMKENLGKKVLSEKEYDEIHKAILNQEVMPSMRLMWSAGKAARTTNVSAYNCSYIAPTQLQDFGEIMYLLMCGTGVGFSVEHQTIQKLPQIKPQTGKKVKTHVVEDSKEGWGNAVVLGLKTWFDGRDIDFDFSKLRPRGTRLKTMGGKSSGPGPLREVLDFARRKILAKQNRRLTPIDAHDIICKIGEVVVMGGVRRSALLSLSDLDDPQMRDAKKGQFYLTQPQRSMANNSASYNEKPPSNVFLDEWISLAKSGTGERGIFNRGGLKYQLPARRWKEFESYWVTGGTNPCGEIILRSKQFCNLSEVVARQNDTKESLLRKIKIATIIGTYQSSLTSFSYLSKEWRKNCEEERLLGVSITGQWDSSVVRDPKILKKLREHSLVINKEFAKRFGINESTCVTCVKPSGTVSQLVDAASGLHPRHSPYYIRRIRISSTDGLFQMLRDQKVPYYPEVGQGGDGVTTYVLEFPVKAPRGAIYRNDLTAIEQLEHWKAVKKNYTEHNPSVTISVGDDEWIAVADWLYENWEILGGLSFLPRADHVYELAPYEEISRERYQEFTKKFPKVDFSQILLYEQDDETQGSKELACVGGVCDII